MPQITDICPPFLIGELSEWLKEHAWKVCIGQKPIKSSNLLLSANPLKSLYQILSNGLIDKENKNK